MFRDSARDATADDAGFGERSPATHRPPAIDPRERRTLPRVELRADAILAAATQFISGVTLDLSERGLFVATDRRIEVGTRVSLELTLPRGQLLARGVVRWRRGGDNAGLGIELDPLSAIDRDLARHALAQP